jgi:hypothetical protein
MGIRKYVIPAALIRTIVVMIFSDPRIEDKPKRITPRKKACIPKGAFVLNGGYPVQPVSNPPRNNARVRQTAAGTLIQKAKAFNLGNAISLAPIINGTR